MFWACRRGTRGTQCFWGGIDVSCVRWNVSNPTDFDVFLACGTITMTRTCMNIHEHAITIYLWVSCSHLHVQPLLSVGSFMTSWLGRRASPCRSLAGTRWVMPQPGGIEIALMGPSLEEYLESKAMVFRKGHGARTLCGKRNWKRPRYTVLSVCLLCNTLQNKCLNSGTLNMRQFQMVFCVCPWSAMPAGHISGYESG